MVLRIPGHYLFDSLTFWSFVFLASSLEYVKTCVGNRHLTGCNMVDDHMYCM